MKPNQKIPKKRKVNISHEPIRINDDAWFYLTPKGFEFVVWSKKFLDQRQCTQFRITHKKIKNILNNNHIYFMKTINDLKEEYKKHIDYDGSEEDQWVLKQFEWFESKLLEHDRESRIQEKKKLEEYIKNEVYEDVEDLGSEAIANHAYENKFEAFRYGYNQALQDLIAYLSK